MEQRYKFENLIILNELKDLSVRIFNTLFINLRLTRGKEFEIIGEAMNRIDKLNPDIQITSKKKIFSMRIHVIHGYDKIDDDIIWGAIVRHLPILKKEVSAILDSKLLEDGFSPILFIYLLNQPG